jgi:hypothetical protein
MRRLRRYRSAIAMAVVCTLIGAGVVTVVYVLVERGSETRRDVDDAHRQSRSNFRAIVASCELLNRKIAEAQRPASRDSSTALLIDALLKEVPAGLREEYLRRLAREQKRPRLTKADCEAEARRAAGV